MNKQAGRLPNFIVIGAPKAGTTSMYHYLSEHPEVFMPEVKEINYFALDEAKNHATLPCGYSINKVHAKNINEYMALYSKIKNEKAFGDASPLYMSSPVAAEKIKKYIPYIKLIASIRNPVDRAISSYFMHVSLGSEKRSINDAFSDLDNEFYVVAGKYYEQLNRFYDRFPDKAIKVVLFDEYKRQTIKTMQDIYSFIGVDNKFCPYTEKIHKKGGVAKNKIAWLVHEAIVRVSRSKVKNGIKNVLPKNTRIKVMQSIRNSLLEYPDVSDEIKKRLMDYYDSDIKKLSTLIGKDLSVWYESVT